MKFKKTKLKNGLRVITVPMVDNPSVTVLVMVEAGSKYETKDVNGISHFLEHLVFKGTKNRPKASDISREFDSIGAEHNAFTSQEYTGYYGKADAKKCDKLLDLLSDMYLYPLIDKVEMEKEKGVIIEEIRMYQDLPQSSVSYLFEELLYGDQPAGWKIIGTEENVRSFTQEQVLKYREEHYKASSTMVIVAGSFDEKTILKKVEKYFIAITPGPFKKKVAVVESQSEPQIKLQYKETDQTHLIIGVRTFPINDPRRSILRVLSTILGGGMSSRLFSKMRNELGICYYVGSSAELSTDHGELAISAGVDNSRVEQGIKGILGECRRLKDEIVEESELQKAKDYIAGRTQLSLETSDSRAEYCGYQEVLKGEIDPPDESIKKIYMVTAKQVQDLAREIFINKSLNMAMIGKSKDPKEFQSYFSLE